MNTDLQRLLIIKSNLVKYSNRDKLSNYSFPLIVSTILILGSIVISVPFSIENLISHSQKISEYNNYQKNEGSIVNHQDKIRSQISELQKGELANRDLAKITQLKWEHLNLNNYEDSGSLRNHWMWIFLHSGYLGLVSIFILSILVGPKGVDEKQLISSAINEVNQLDFTTLNPTSEIKQLASEISTLSPASDFYFGEELAELSQNLTNIVDAAEYEKHHSEKTSC
jgi:hypothetical protein